jgi:hypothetical protein
MARIAEVLLTSIILDVFLIATSWWYFKKRDHEIIKSRLPYLVLVNAVSGIALTHKFLLDFPLFETTMPCVISFILYYVFVPTWLFTFLLRSGYLLLAHVSSQARLEYSNTGKITIYDKMSRLDKLVFNMQLFLFNAKSGVDTSGHLTFRQLKRSFIALGFAITIAFALLLVLKGGDLSTCPAGDYLVLYGLMGIFLLIIPYLLYSLRSVNDCLHIRREIMVTLGMFYPTVALFLPNMFIPGDPAAPKTTGAFLYTLVLVIMTQIVCILYPLYMVYKSEIEMKSLKLDPASFEKAIQDPTMFKELKEILAKSFCIENGLFLEEFQSLKGRRRSKSIRQTGITIKSYLEATNSQLVPDSTIVIQSGNQIKEYKRLYDTFIKPGSPQELNITSLLREKITLAVNQLSENQEAPENLFDEVATEVKLMIYLNTFPKFIAKRNKS